jgi:hypothetical protein
MNLLARANRTSKLWAQVAVIGAAALLIAACLGLSGFSIQLGPLNKMNADLQPFVGTWQAKFKGKVFQTIKLEKKDDKLSGTVSHADIKVDPKSGELTEVKVSDHNDAIVEATLKNGTLLITEPDDIQFEMKITGADEAQLQIVIPADAAEEVPTPKPWKLVRAKSKD